MCGLLAAFFSNASTVHPIDALLEASKTETLKARGPDVSTTIWNSKEFLTFHQLSITAPDSTHAVQPLRLNHLLLLCNGQIYNYQQLAKSHGFELTTGSDCEVILHLYEKYGSCGIFEELEGVFAFVLVDRKAGKVIVGRDRFGVRPLFFGTLSSGGIAFSSVAAALLPVCCGVQQFPHGFLETYRIGTETCDDGQVIYCTYEHKSLSSCRTGFPLTEKSSIREAVISAVRKRMKNIKRPLGCLLSGGLDSSIIASILSQRLKRKHKSPLHTFTVAMVPEGGVHESCDTPSLGPDSDHAWKVVRFLGKKVKHTEIRFTATQGFAMLKEVIGALETYDITTIRASVPMYFACKYIKECTDIKVLFSGEGADEIFGGYLYFHKAPNFTAVKEESNRLLNYLPFFDVLRADRCTAANGLELRVPFLDPSVLMTAKQTPNWAVPHEGMEKHTLRTQFVGDLPNSVLWRTKDGMSDGVSGDKTWAQCIAEMVEPLITDEEFAYYNTDSIRFPSKEALYYYKIFQDLFSGQEDFTKSCLPFYWMPKWVESNDPSGRLLMSSKK